MRYVDQADFNRVMAAHYAERRKALPTNFMIAQAAKHYRDLVNNKKPAYATNNTAANIGA